MPRHANLSERAKLPPELAVSTVIFALAPRPAGGGAPSHRLRVALVRRLREPYKGLWALPGGPITQSHSLLEAAQQNLHSTTGLSAGYLEQLYAFGGLERSPGPRVVSIVYWALLRLAETPDAEATVAADEHVSFFDIDDLPPLAFDHAEIVRYALWRLRTKVTYGSIAYRVLGDTFTIGQVREVYESILDRALDPGNFQRRITAAEDIERTDQVLSGVPHRPPRLYRFAGDADTRQVPGEAESHAGQHRG